jgi:hypothetical protein
VLFAPTDPQVVRLVTHYGIEEPDINLAIERIGRLLVG